ncbi:MAG: TetR/AcrR family transcriptional regulator, partial [Synechococcaceae cyanobacterium]|nr:TetR/AcrR family transcriptional regulator [Synechococcaceae cyanobacterium]
MERQSETNDPTPRAAPAVNTVRGSENLREKLIVAAQELFVADGVAGISMRKLADKVGVTAPAIYRHFKDKDELLEELINVGLQILQTYLEPA